MSRSSRTALVTGGALRIGKAITLRLAAMGCNVVIHYRKSEKPARELSQTLEKAGVRAWPVRGELDTPEACDTLWNITLAAAGKIDLLVNNAAIFERTAFRESRAEDFERFWHINTLAPILMTRHFSRQKHFAHPDSNTAHVSPSGQAIQLLDQRIAHPEAGAIPYFISKQALQAFTLSAALELAPRIRVNAIAPGAVLPPPGKHEIPEPAGRAPLQERCTPEDIALAVEFLVQSPCITGQILYIDSGQHLRPGLESPVAPAP